jgi:hypothetical protein
MASLARAYARDSEGDVAAALGATGFYAGEGQGTSMAGLDDLDETAWARMEAMVGVESGGGPGGGGQQGHGLSVSMIGRSLDSTFTDAGEMAKPEHHAAGGKGNRTGKGSGGGNGTEGKAVDPISAAMSQAGPPNGGTEALLDQMDVIKCIVMRKQLIQRLGKLTRNIREQCRALRGKTEGETEGVGGGGVGGGEGIGNTGNTASSGGGDGSGDGGTATATTTAAATAAERGGAEGAAVAAGMGLGLPSKTKMADLRCLRELRNNQDELRLSLGDLRELTINLTEGVLVWRRGEARRRRRYDGASTSRPEARFIFEGVNVLIHLWKDLQRVLHQRGGGSGGGRGGGNQERWEAKEEGGLEETSRMAWGEEEGGGRSRGGGAQSGTCPAP